MKIPFMASETTDAINIRHINRDNIKRIIFIGVVVFLAVVCVFASSQLVNALNTKQVPLSGEQTQINELSSQLSILNKTVSQLQTQMKAIASTPVPVSSDDAQNVAQVSSSVDALTGTVGNIGTQIGALKEDIRVLQQSMNQNTSSIGTLQSDVSTLQNNLKANATNIGTSSMQINGLDVTFITNNIDIGTTSSSTQGTAQFAIKIANLTNSNISNLDVTGIIRSSQFFSYNMADGYPKLTDASGSSTIAFSNTGTNIISFEEYGGKKGLSIPIGGSVTLRPNLSILATKDSQIPACMFTVAVNAITYDIVH